MKKYYVIISLLFVACELLAQTHKTDLEKDNLKGNVSFVDLSTKVVVESWGEERVELTPIARYYYNPDGNLVLNQFWGASLTKLFLYDESNRLTEVRYFNYGYSEGEDPAKCVTASWKELEEYEYDAKGRVRSIDYFENDNGNKSRSVSYFFSYYRGREYDSSRSNNYISKEVFKYDDNGYEHIFIDYEGKTQKKEVVSENGKRMENNMGISLYDDMGRLICAGGSIKAANGSAEWGKYYYYNENGDLIFETHSTEISKQVDNTPWLTENYTHSGDYYYEYEYDSYGNWIECRKYKTRNREQNQSHLLVETRVRTIRYGGDYIKVKTRFPSEEISEAAGLLSEFMENTWLVDNLYEAYLKAEKALEINNDDGEAYFLKGYTWLFIFIPDIEEFAKSRDGIDEWVYYPGKYVEYTDWNRYSIESTMYDRCCIAADFFKKALLFLPEDHMWRDYAEMFLNYLMNYPIMRSTYHTDTFRHTVFRPERVSSQIILRKDGSNFYKIQEEAPNVFGDLKWD